LFEWNFFGSPLGVVLSSMKGSSFFIYLLPLFVVGGVSVPFLFITCHSQRAL
jgi:hypothetical protein